MRIASMLPLTLVFVLGCDRGATPSESAAPTTKAEGEGASEAEAEALPATEGSDAVEGEGAVPAAVVAAPVDDPGSPEADPSHRLDAPAQYERVAIRAALPVGPRYVDLVYEGNNKNFRGKLGADGLYRSGEDTASDWRRYAAGVGGLVVLRDSLFSQQDHPCLQAPRALMLPPNWVTVAVDAVLRGGIPTAPHSAADIEDDAAWAAGERDIHAYFGSFPVSERLFGDATRPLAGADAPQQAMTRNARRSLQMLAAAAQAMIDAAPSGAAVVADTGAEWISASDRSYFGAKLRASTIIPIFVEHPNEHEARDEGKGLIPWEAQLDPNAVALTRRAVYGRRLRDGALALERYDLRSKAEQDRALALLEELVPGGSKGAKLWLWVNGGSDGHGKGEPATPYVAAFRQRLEAANIELERVVLFSKPSVRPRGASAKAELDAALEAHAALDIPLSAQLRTSQLQKLIGGEG